MVHHAVAHQPTSVGRSRNGHGAGLANLYTSHTLRHAEEAMDISSTSKAGYL